MSTRFSKRANRARIVGAAAALCVVLLSAAHAFERMGQTYPIAEPDALDEFRSRASAVDWNAHLNPTHLRRLVANHRPEELHSLPEAQEDGRRLVDVTYTLDFDVPDGTGGILYPAGYTFNPLDYIALPTVLVVIDGSDPDHVEWFNQSTLPNDPRVKLLLSDGDYVAVIDQVKQPVYYLTRDIAARFQLRAVPCIAFQNTNKVEVREYRLPRPEESALATPN